MKPIHIILLMLFALDVLGIGGLWYGSTIMRTEKDREITIRQDLLNEEQGTKKILGQQRLLQSTEAERQALSEFLFKPTDEDQIKFISSIERLGTSTSGAVVETVSLDIAKTNILSGEFSIKGTWPQIYHTLRLIEEFPARIVVTKMDAKEGSSGMWNGSVRIELLSIKGAILPPAEPAVPVKK